MASNENLTEAEKVKVEKLFNSIVYCEHNKNTNNWSFYIKADGCTFTAKILFSLCEILNCAPEELFWNPDLDYSDVYYDGDNPTKTLVFEIHKK